MNLDGVLIATVCDEVDAPTTSDEAENYTLDPEGNRAASHLSNDHQTDAANRLQSDDRYSYTYDLNGNLIGKTAKPDTDLPDWNYRYDSLDQLISVSRDSLEVERYRYDAFGRRTRIETSGAPALGLANDGSDRTLDLVASDPGTGAGASNGEAALLHRYTHSDRVDDQLQLEVVSDTGSDVYTYHSDHLGSVRALTNSAGTVTHAYDYDSYGQLIAEAEPTGAENPFRYTGREWDAAAELYHYRARGYDASTGRFLQEDPIGFAAGDYNIYRYAWNNPLKFTDSSGLSGEYAAIGTRSAGQSAGIAGLGAGIACLFSQAATTVALSGLGYDVRTVLCGAQIVGGSGPKFFANDNASDSEGSPLESEGESGPDTPAPPIAGAPGTPSAEDGFKPPKGWNGGKRRAANGQYGYPDRNGDIWVPTGNGGVAHGGPHWDVQGKRGGAIVMFTPEVELDPGKSEL